MSPEERAKAMYEMRIKCPYKKKIKTTSRRNIARYIIKNDKDKTKFSGITEHLFNLVITRIMQLKEEYLCKNGYVQLDPYIGSIRLIQNDREIEDYNKLSIDWKRTLELWLDNPKAKENKTKVRYLNQSYAIEIVWVRGFGVKNIDYYSFRPSRTLAKNVYKKHIEKQDITLLMK